MVFINFWPKAGMRHYSDGLVSCISKQCEVHYFSNYEHAIPVNQYLFEMTLNPFSFKNYRALFLLSRELKLIKPDIVHINSGYPILLPVYFLFSFYHSVVTVHDAIPHEGERLLKRIFHKIQMLAFSLFFKKIIVHSELIKNQLPFFVHKVKVYVMPHVSYRYLASDASADQRQEHSVFSVLFFGRILKYKGLEYLIEAFKGLDSLKYKLVIAGEGRIDCEIANKNISVINTYIKDEEMVELFHQANIVVLPYVTASQSGVAKLALAFNKPVIATNVGSIADEVKDGINGLIIPPCSSESLREAIIRISDKEVYDSFEKNIKDQNAKEEDDVTSRILSIYGFSL